MRRGVGEGTQRDGMTVSSVEEEGAVGLPEPLLEQPQGAPPLSELSADSLALVVDGPSLVSRLERVTWPRYSTRLVYATCEVSPSGCG